MQKVVWVVGDSVEESFIGFIAEAGERRRAVGPIVKFKLWRRLRGCVGTCH